MEKLITELMEKLGELLVELNQLQKELQDLRKKQCGVIDGGECRFPERWLP